MGEPRDTNSERRDAERAQRSIRIRYKSLDAFIEAHSADISRGGVFLVARRFLPIESVVRLELELPDGPVVPAIARVAYILDAEQAQRLGREPGMGMEFLDTHRAEVAHRIADYLTTRLGAQPTVEDARAPAHVLVVDDDHAHREAARAALSGRGDRVVLAEDGLEALGMVMREPPDVIVSDVQMPNLDGWQLLRLLRSRPRVANIPVVFLTSLADDEQRLRGYQLGVDDYIAKPFRPDELRVRLDHVLSRARTRPNASATRNALRGDLSHVSLASLLGFAEIERRTGVLLVVHARELATLYMRDGNVVRIELSGHTVELDGLERAFHVLDWDDGRFEFTPAEVAFVDTVGMPTGALLLEHARRNDEKLR